MTVNGKVTQVLGYSAPSPLDQIDPASIETIEVLKGPSAIAIYGSDAANGVIVVTTKHGRASRGTIKDDSTAGTGERTTIMLPDDASVALNVGSRLEVPTDYLAGNHTVLLVGEALFTQHHSGPR